MSQVSIRGSDNPMNPHRFPQHPQIALSDLARLTFDPVSAQRYERRLRSAMLPGMLLAFANLLAGYFLYRAGVVTQNSGGVICFAGGAPGLVLAFARYRRVSRQRPLSAQSHQEMMPFVVLDRTRTDESEIAYIDEASGTYFIRRISA